MTDIHEGNIQPSLDYEEHDGTQNSKRAVIAPTSFYQQLSGPSGYNFYGFAAPGSNPTTAVWKILRETSLTGEVLFANGVPTFINVWSAASLGSISYS